MCINDYLVFTLPKNLCQVFLFFIAIATKALGLNMLESIHVVYEGERP